METDEIQFKPRKAVSKKLAQDLIKEAGIKEVPVSLQKVIDYLQTKYSLDVHRVNFGNTVSGLMVRIKNLDSEYASIGFNQNQPWCRRRFTICHEIGHLLMEHECKPGENTNEEKEADCFAAELLMPKKFLRSDFPKIKNIKELAKLYRVSEQAMSIKIMNDRLLK